MEGDTTVLPADGKTKRVNRRKKNKVEQPDEAPTEITPSIPELLKRNNLSLQDFDYYEFHEAFASTVLATLKSLEEQGLGTVDRDKVNVKGSSLAAGHPFAATGGRIVASLAKMLADKGPGSRGLISICAAGGQGVVAILEAHARKSSDRLVVLLYEIDSDESDISSYPVAS